MTEIIVKLVSARDDETRYLCATNAGAFSLVFNDKDAARFTSSGEAHRAIGSFLVRVPSACAWIKEILLIDPPMSDAQWLRDLIGRRRVTLSGAETQRLREIAAKLENPPVKVTIESLEEVGRRIIT